MAQRRRAAAAILFLPVAEIFRVRVTGAEAVAAADFDPFRAFAHLAFCARAIFRREAADIIPVGRVDLLVSPLPFKDSITKIA